MTTVSVFNISRIYIVSPTKSFIENMNINYLEPRHVFQRKSIVVSFFTGKLIEVYCWSQLVYIQICRSLTRLFVNHKYNHRRLNLIYMISFLSKRCTRSDKNLNFHTENCNPRSNKVESFP